MQTNDIPSDFPSSNTPGAVAGAMPKVLLCKIGEEYFLGQTDQERAERYDICVDMVEQLVAYCHRKARENPSLSLQLAVDRASGGLRDKVRNGLWQFSSAEVDWMVNRVRINVSLSN